MDLHPHINQLQIIVIVHNLQLVESEDAEPVDTKGHCTLFSFPHSRPETVWGSYLPLSHSGNQVPFKSVHYSRVCSHLF